MIPNKYATTRWFTICWAFVKRKRTPLFLVAIVVILFLVNSYVLTKFPGVTFTKVKDKVTPEPKTREPTARAETRKEKLFEKATLRRTVTSKGTTPQPVSRSKEACKIPKLTPGGKYVLSIDDIHPQSPTCISENTLRFKIDFQNNLHRLLEDDDSWWSSVDCFYKPRVRNPELPDFHLIENQPEFAIEESITKLPDDIEHIYVQCYREDAGRNSTVYTDFLTAVQEKPALEKQLTESFRKFSVDGEYYNIMIIGQDGSSHMNFRRYMPLAHDYLKKELGAVEFSGFNSLGPGTLWSVFALWTGLDLNEFRKKCWSSEWRHFDDCPFIWKDFARRGYRTSYDEDELVSTGIFNEKKGFKRQPFHYDMRTARISKPTQGHASSTCFGARLSFSVLLDSLARLATTFPRKPFFSFMWSQALSHNVNSLSKFGDRPLLEHLRYLREQRLLNRTFLILFSDHGMRYGSLRMHTRQGFLEERLPILYIVVPPTFRQKYPEASKNLEENSEKLTTAFDVYETMRDILDLQEVEAPRLSERARDPKIQGARNVSLFLPINVKRTCEMIGFSFIYCACLRRESLARDNGEVVRAAGAILEEINMKLSNYSECSPLKLVRITDAVRLGVEWSTKDEFDRFKMSNSGTNQSMGVQMEIGIRTEPGRGVFYSSVLMTNSMSFVREITRITMYGDDANCMPVKELKPLCFCVANQTKPARHI